MHELRLINFTTHKSMGIYEFKYIPNQADIINIDDKTYRVIERLHEIPSGDFFLAVDLI